MGNTVVYRIIFINQHLLTTKCGSAFLDQGCIQEADDILRGRRQPLEQPFLFDNLKNRPKEIT